MTQPLRQRWEGFWHSLGVTGGLSAPVIATTGCQAIPLALARKHLLILT